MTMKDIILALIRNRNVLNDEQLKEFAKQHLTEYANKHSNDADLGNNLRQEINKL